jgi:ferric-dicitrate binding protein FerR (iron transport regulator)
MSSLDCIRMRRLLLAAVGGHLDEAERLELESHLEVCTECRTEHASWEGLRRLKTWEPPQLESAARARVREALRARRAPEPVSTDRRAWPPLLAAALAASLLLAGAGTLWTHRPSRVLDGDVEVAPSSWWSIPDGARLLSQRGGHVALNGPVVLLEPGTELAWHEGTATATLAVGAVEVEVDPALHAAFQVSTSRFSVEVLGTHFRVDADSVRTERGVVRVVDTAGAPLAVVAAGESWTYPEKEPAVRVAPPTGPVPPVVFVEPQLPPRSVVPHVRPVGGAPLAAVRHALAQGDAQGARSLLAPLLDGALAPESNTLLAESYLVEGNYASALAQYESVARRFQGTPQAESALYATAQLQVEHGGRDEAVRSLARYLEQYPRGRFASEVQARLETLGGSSGR